MFYIWVGCIGFILVVVQADLHCSESALTTDDDVMLLQSSMQVKSPDLVTSVEGATKNENITATHPLMLQRKTPDNDYLDDTAESTGSNSEEDFWPRNVGRDPLAVFFAAVWTLLIASLPIIVHHGGLNGVTPIVITEAILVLLWLVGGLYLFTQDLLFESTHFGKEPRTLTLVEAVYMFAQILTLVGYGDIIPANRRGELFVGLFLILAILLIVNLLHNFMFIISTRMEQKVNQMGKIVKEVVGSSQEKAKKLQTPQGPSFSPVFQSMFGFTFCIFVGTLFFHLCPGENKTVSQALYMSIITLSTVGFGKLTPVTEVGMVFAAFWMIFGVASLGSLLASFTSYMGARKKFEFGRKMQTGTDAGAILRREYADRNGFVDQLGYLRYNLLKSNRVKKEELDHIMNQFDMIDVEGRGVLRADLVIHHCA